MNSAGGHHKCAYGCTTDAYSVNMVAAVQDPGLPAAHKLTVHKGLYKMPDQTEDLLRLIWAAQKAVRESLSEETILTKISEVQDKVCFIEEEIISIQQHLEHCEVVPWQGQTQIVKPIGPRIHVDGHLPASAKRRWRKKRERARRQAMDGQ